MTHLKLWTLLQVRSRTPSELEENLSAAKMLQRETAFFASHEELRGLSSEMKGLPALIQKLIRLQDQRLQEFLPNLKRQASYDAHRRLSCRHQSWSCVQQTARLRLV